MASTVSAPFSSWNETDHSGPILISTTLCMLYWFVAGTMQQIMLFVRGNRYGWAEYFQTGAMAAAFVQSTLILAASHYGLGHSAMAVQQWDLAEGRRLYRISNIFYAVALGLIKCSAALFVANLTVKNMGSLRRVPTTQKWTLIAILALVTAWTIGCVAALASPCKSTSTGVCMGTVGRWVGIFVGDAATDLAISASAGSIILRTRASIGKKLVWFLPFVVRICVPLIAGLRLLSISAYNLTHDPTISLWLFVTLTQLQVMVSLISAAIPALKQTLLDLSTQYGQTADSQSGSRKHGSSYALGRMRPKQSRKEQSVFDHEPSPGMGASPAISLGAAKTARNRTHAKSAGDIDGESQDGIVRHDEFEVSWDNGNISDRDTRSEDEYLRS